jgi:hypothetical protein
MTQQRTAPEFADRFFDRQRREIMSRIEALETRRKTRVWRGLLVAASLALACLAAGVALEETPEPRHPAAREAWIGTELWPVGGGDPLAAYAGWNGHTAADGIDPLPSFELVLEPADQVPVAVETNRPLGEPI